MFSQVDQFLQGLIDENDADERSKSFLSEACDVADKRAGVGGHQQQTEKGRPQANTGPQGEVGKAVFPETDTNADKRGRQGCVIFHGIATDA